MYKVGDIRKETGIKNGKVIYVRYGVCTAVHTSSNPQLCGASWRLYGDDDVPSEVRNTVTIHTYHFV